MSPMTLKMQSCVDMAKWAGRIEFGLGQTGHFKQVKNEFGSIGLQVGSS